MTGSPGNSWHHAGGARPVAAWQVGRLKNLEVNCEVVSKYLSELRIQSLEALKVQDSGPLPTGRTPGRRDGPDLDPVTVPGSLRLETGTVRRTPRLGDAVPGPACHVGVPVARESARRRPGGPTVRPSRPRPAGDCAAASLRARARTRTHKAKNSNNTQKTCKKTCGSERAWNHAPAMKYRQGGKYTHWHRERQS